MNKYYEELDWPILPDELVSSLIKWGVSAERAVPNKRNAVFAFLKTPWYLRDWVVRNIPVEINENWAVALQRFSGKQAGFHIDSCRDWSYNCVIFGDTGITKFKPTFDSEEELYKIKESFPDAEIVMRIATKETDAKWNLSEKFGVSLSKAE